jgi:hypothetical protein
VWGRLGRGLLPKGSKALPFQTIILFGLQPHGQGTDMNFVETIFVPNLSQASPVLIVLNGEVRPGEEIHRTSGVVSQISLKYDVVTSYLFMPTERYSHEQSPLLRNVRREGVTV